MAEIHFRNSPVEITFALRGRPDPLGSLANIRFKDVRSGASLQVRFLTRNIALQLPGRTTTFRLTGAVRMRYDAQSWLRAEILKFARSSRGRKLASQTAWNRLIKVVGEFYLEWFFDGAQRVSSGRAAPKRWYPATASPGVIFRPRAPRVYDEVDPKGIGARRDSHVSKLESPSRLREILRELEIASSIEDSQLSAYHSAILVRDSITGIKSNLIDIGYGASQVIPIIQACLSGARGPLVIEQPEIHLHPRAQGRLAELICETSLRRQVIVETHSVHMINHARILIASGELRPEHVMINYVYRTRTGSHVKGIPLASNGDFLGEWPEGFFDERYQDTLKLLELKGTSA